MHDHQADCRVTGWIIGIGHVQLSEERWLHIVEGHPELASHRNAVLQAVGGGSHARRPGEVWCYLEGVGPTGCLKVVVAYEGPKGRIVTAFFGKRPA